MATKRQPRSRRARRSTDGSTPSPQAIPTRDSTTEEVFQTTGQILAALEGAIGAGGGGESAIAPIYVPRGGAKMFRASNSFKKFTWTPSIDIVIVGVQKVPGSTGGLLVATEDLASALFSQWPAGTQKDSVIYSDAGISSATDPIAGTVVRYHVKAGTKITLWYETTAEGAIVVFYVNDIATN